LEIIAFNKGLNRKKEMLISFKTAEVRDWIYDLIIKAHEERQERIEDSNENMTGILGELDFGQESGKKKKFQDRYGDNDNKESNSNKVTTNMDAKSPQGIHTNFEIEKYTQMWVEGEISNYEYLCRLNCAANRTKLDLSQYPVFPWILTDYESEVLRINDDSIYRDLTKPIGAMNQQRLNAFLERYREMPEPKYIYGTHYSNPSYSVGYLFRKFPQWMLKLNGGKFDHPDRLFASVAVDWNICNQTTSSLKELIPEFFEEDNSFLMNNEKIDFGENVQGKKVNNVDLPPWANDSFDFLRKMRLCLESKYVNDNLHHWIDLIFGHKQRGKAAVESYNLFHHLTYQANVDLSKVTDYKERKALEVQIAEFGITPFQLFKEAHPKRFSSKIVSMNFKSIQEEILKEEHIEVVKPKVKADIIQIIDSKPKQKIVSKNFSSSRLALNKLPAKKLTHSFEFTKLNRYHFGSITSIDFLDNLMITGGSDGFIKVADLSRVRDKELFPSNCISNNFNKSNSGQVIANYDTNISNRLLLKKMQSPGGTALSKVKTINKSLLVAADQDGMINIFNFALGKHITSSQAYIDKVFDFYNFDTNLLTISSNSSCLLYSLNSNLKTPIGIFRDLDKRIVSSDFRLGDNLLVTADESGVVVMRNMKQSEKMFSFKVKGEYGDTPEIKYVKFNPVNENEYFVCTEDSFRVYDVRSNGLVGEVEFFYNTMDIENDSLGYIVCSRNGVQLYLKDINKRIGLANSFSLDDSVVSTFQNNQLVNHKYTNNYESSINAVGCENGNLYFSSVINKK